MKVTADLQYSSSDTRITVSKGGKKSKQEVVYNVNILVKLLHPRQAISHISICRSSAEVYRNMQQQCFVGDVAVETFLQSLALYDTKLGKTSRNCSLKSTESLLVTLSFFH